jgi:hypothetical protein
LKKVLIISPYFPPVNAADMHRVRTSLPYFNEFGWAAEVVTIDTAFTDVVTDELLLKSIPTKVKIHKIKALNKSTTSKVGLGSIALRSLWYYFNYVNRLLKQTHFDLIYFSTTQFPVCCLGAYWKKKFKIPYVIDMQDPWHSEYYQDKPKAQQPKKYWFSYRLNKLLEPIALKYVDGLISVSDDYIKDLKTRYPQINHVPSFTITFGMFAPDLNIALQAQNTLESLLEPAYLNIVYVGRGGTDMHKAIEPVFKALSDDLAYQRNDFERLRLYFIGTSYAPVGKGTPTITPFAQKFGIADKVIEITDRLSYYHSLATLLMADALFIPGSDDARYTASKIYPYLLTKKPLLAIFNQKSSALGILKEFDIKTAYSYETVSQNNITSFLNGIIQKSIAENIIPDAVLDKHSARAKTQTQCDLFDEVISLNFRKK